MPSKYQPDVKYLRYVKAKRVHLFTFIQILSIGSLFVIKYIEQVAITFPILVILYIKFLFILFYLIID